MNTDLYHANLYENLVHEPENLLVKTSYQSLIDALLAQYEHLLEHLTFTFGNYQYSDSASMFVDIEQNHHLYVYATGSEDFAPNHPMTKQVTVNGRGLCVNDVFRAVHDVYGHYATRCGFGPQGEFEAWVNHMSSLPQESWLALFCETRGQNAWTNAYDNHASLPLSQRPFAHQKVGLLNDEEIFTSDVMARIESVQKPRKVFDFSW